MQHITHVDDVSIESHLRHYKGEDLVVERKRSTEVKYKLELKEMPMGILLAKQRQIDQTSGDVVAVKYQLLKRKPKQ